MLKTYYSLTKPGIIYGNALTAIGGFLLGANGHWHDWLLLAMVVGVSLVIASGCVFNNYIDRPIDRTMKRTKKRALVSGAVSGRSALLYATVLGAAGFAVLAAYTNLLTVAIGLVGFVDYVVLYGIGKRRSVYGTIIGSVSGATPIVAGYCAATNRFDGAALILFLILTIWQMPHFYAIAMYRADEYAAAGLPVLPIKKGMRAAKMHIVAYAAAFVLAVTALAAFGYAGYTYALIMGGLGLWWLYMGIRGFGVPDDARWARKMFLFSLVIILALSVTLSVDALLP